MENESAKKKELSDKECGELRALINIIGKGDFDKDRVKAAAALGDPVAQQVGLIQAELPTDYRLRVQTVLSFLPERDRVRFALDCASRVLSKWETIRPNDNRPRAALESTHSWLLRGGMIDLLQNTSSSAANAGCDAYDLDQLPANRILASGIFAADSAAHVPLAAKYVGHLGIDPDVSTLDVSECVSYAADFAALAATNTDEEKKWQVNRLCEYLLNRANP